MPIPRDYILHLDPARRPPHLAIDEHVVEDNNWYNENCSSSRRYDPVLGVEGVVIHATAGGTSGGALAWWKSPAGAKASAHWIVPSEIEPLHGRAVIAAVYEARAAWHVRNDCLDARVNGGRNLINHWTLGIEVVNTQAPGDSYSDWQVQATADIVRYCWAKYPNLRWVFSHAAVDPGRRVDPGAAFPWDAFVARVNAPAGRPSMTVAAVPAGPHDGVPC